MGVATDCSTAIAEAPGYVAVTRIVGGARNGYCSMLRPFKLKSPIKTRMIEMTIATIGLRMKKFAMGYALVSSCFSAGIIALGTAGVVGSAGTVLATTLMPGLTFWIPSTITFSPGFNPESI